MEHPIRKKSFEVENKAAGERPAFTIDHVAGWDLERRVVLTKEPGVEHYTVTALTQNEINGLLYYWEKMKVAPALYLRPGDDGYPEA
jgi:hypothetical protein